MRDSALLSEPMLREQPEEAAQHPRDGQVDQHRTGRRHHRGESARGPRPGGGHDQDADDPGEEGRARDRQRDGDAQQGHGQPAAQRRPFPVTEGQREREGQHQRHDGAVLDRVAGGRRRPGEALPHRHRAQGVVHAQARDRDPVDEGEPGGELRQPEDREGRAQRDHSPHQDQQAVPGHDAVVGDEDHSGPSRQQHQAEGRAAVLGGVDRPAVRRHEADADGEPEGQEGVPHEGGARRPRFGARQLVGDPPHQAACGGHRRRRPRPAERADDHPARDSQQQDDVHREHRGGVQAAEGAARAETGTGPGRCGGRGWSTVTGPGAGRERGRRPRRPGRAVGDDAGAAADRRWSARRAARAPPHRWPRAR